MLLRDYVSSQCGTGPIKGLTHQILETLTSELPPGTLVDVSDHVHPRDITVPFLQKEAAEALIAAILEKDEKLPLVHAIRVLPQQYAVHRWAQQHRCGITRAAPPSRSNHEGARAIDVDGDHINSWKTVLNHHGWVQTVLPADPAHFDFTGNHDPDFVPKAVLAFQKLWNTHNPNDLIAEDGTYGPETERRLKASPIAGF